MKVINVLYCVLACSMYQNVLSNGYLSILLSHGDIRCISEIFHKGAEVSMNIAAISKSKNIDAQLISFVARNHLGEIILDERISISEAHESHDMRAIIKLHGNCKFCFEYLFFEGHHEEKAVNITFYFGEETKSYHHKIQKLKTSEKEMILPLTEKFADLESSISNIHAEFEFARKREKILNDTSKTTASNVKWMSGFSISILLLASLWQILYLRHYFYLKKLL